MTAGIRGFDMAYWTWYRFVAAPTRKMFSGWHRPGSAGADQWAASDMQPEFKGTWPPKVKGT